MQYLMQSASQHCAIPASASQLAFLSDSPNAATPFELLRAWARAYFSGKLGGLGGGRGGAGGDGCGEGGGCGGAGGDGGGSGGSGGGGGGDDGSKARGVAAAWPVGFYFHSVAADMAARGAGVGTRTVSEFVAVDSEGGGVVPSDPLDDAEDKAYPPLRRARRLSFVAAALLDGLTPSGQPGGGGATIAGRSNPRQRLLETASTDGRLQIILKRFETINRVLRGYVDAK